MILSNALPVQFFPYVPRNSGATRRLSVLFVAPLNGAVLSKPTYGLDPTPVTFNELQNGKGTGFSSTGGGLGPPDLHTGFRFVQPVDFGDPLVIQFQSGPGVQFVLNMIREDGSAYLFNSPFTEVISGVYQITIAAAVGLPHDWGQYILSIATIASVVTANIIPNPTFTGGGGGWGNFPVGGTNWVSAGVTGVVVTLTAAAPNSNIIARSVAFTDTLSTQTHKATVTGTATQNAATYGVRGYLRVYYYKDGAEVTKLRRDVPIRFNTNLGYGPSLVTNVNFRGLIPADTTDSSNVFDNIGFSAHMTYYGDPAATLVVQIDNVVMAVHQDNMDIYAKSDYLQYGWNEWLELEMNQPEDTVLISYTNNSDFAGLEYTGISPGPEFSIRIPAVFDRNNGPKTEEVHPLSNDTFIRIWSRLEKKRLLEIGHMPDYMHEKLNLIFMHDFIHVGKVNHVAFVNNNQVGDNPGIDVVVRDPYEIADGDKRFPMRRASILLTDQDYIKRNLI